MQLQKEYIQLMKQWQDTEPVVYKTNIKRLCDIKGVKPRHIVDSLNITRNKAVSLINPSHKGKVEFYDALRLAELLSIDVENFLANN